MSELRKRDFKLLAAVERGDPVSWEDRFHAAWLIDFCYLKVNPKTGKTEITPKGKICLKTKAK